MMADTAGLSIQFAAATDIGCVRKNNEDSFGYDNERHLYVVCDGMGGGAAGEVASGLTVRAVIESFAAWSPATDTESGTAERLLRAIERANQVVYETAQKNPQYRGMGTTLVLACFAGNQVLVGNVGDSRAYRVRDGSCVQITLDHSLLDEQLRLGAITPEIAAASGMQSVITRAIGVAETVEPDFFTAEVKLGDQLLLTTDGLTRYAQAEEIASIALEVSELTAICQELIDHAKRRGGVDNITCMMLRAVELTPPEPPVTGDLPRRVDA